MDSRPRLNVEGSPTHKDIYMNFYRRVVHPARIQLDEAAGHTKTLDDTVWFVFIDTLLASYRARSIKSVEGPPRLTHVEFINEPSYTAFILEFLKWRENV